MNKYLSSLLFSLLIVTFFTQCSEEIYEPIVGTHFSPHNKKFTYSDFLKETNANEFNLYQKYRISKSKNGVLQRNIETEFVTDTTEIKKYVDHELEKTTYTFKLYPFYEDLASKEYYNLVVEKYGDQLSFIIFFNKEKLNYEEDEIPLDFSQMVYHSRSPHQGFEEVITWKYHCNYKGDCSNGVCDLCSQCLSYAVSYVYVGSQPVNHEIAHPDPNPNWSGSGGYNGGVYIPNPYDGLNDLSNPMMILAGQINEFLNSLATPLKNAATSSGIYELTHAYFLQMGLNGHSQQHYTASLSNYLSIISGLNMNQLSFDAQQKFRFWCFTTLLHNNFNGENTEKIANIKNFLNNQNVNSDIKDKLINLLYTDNQQNTLNFVSDIYEISINVDSVELNNFLDDVGFYIQNNQIEQAKVITTFTKLKSNPQWIPSSGNYNNVPSLSYNYVMNRSENGVPFVYYHLTNGDILCRGDYGVGQDVFMQLHYFSQSMKQYFKIPEPSSYNHLNLDFIFNAFWSGVSTFVRYCTPLEEVIVLIDGKDFDGVSQSKAVAGIFILVDIVPGGKVIRITRKAGHALSATSPVIKRLLTVLQKSQRNLVLQYKGIISTMNNIRKGNFGEICTDVDFISKGYEALHIRRVNNIDAGGHHGIDHIFKNPITGEFVIVESKFHGTGGLSTLSNGTRQMSDVWISNGAMNSTDRLWVALGGDLNLYNQIRPNASTLNYQRVVAYVLPDGTVNYKYVSSQGVEINTIFSN